MLFKKSFLENIFTQPAKLTAKHPDNSLQESFIYTCLPI